MSEKCASRKQDLLVRWMEVCAGHVGTPENLAVAGESYFDMLRSGMYSSRDVVAAC